MAGLRTRVTGGLAVAALALPVAAAASPGTGQAGPAPANADPAAAALTQIRGTLNGVTAVSARDAWAVGYACATPPVCTGLRSLIVHWNGTAWSVVPSPGPAKNHRDVPVSVSADSARDAWAVGTTLNTTLSFPYVRTLFLHWNGTAWAKVKGPNPGHSDTLGGVIALSPTNAWAVGYDCVAHCQGNQGAPIYHTLILHWNGTAWSQVPSPSPGPTVNLLTSVSAGSATDIWAAGSYEGLTLTLHWNGTTWSQVPSPSPGTPNNGQLTGVSVASPTSVLAVGSYCASECGLAAFKDATLGMHWDGTAWALTPTPSPHSTRPALTGVSALSATNAWAVGDYAINTQTLIAHWNGTAWSRVPSPNPNGGNNGLSGVYARTATDAWAVGSSVGAGNVLILHWNGKAWSVVLS